MMPDVAMVSRDDAYIYLDRLVPPTRVNSPFGSHGEALPEVPAESRNLIQQKVPPFASSKKPALPFLRAPVKAPSSYPKNSDSKRLAGMAPQLIFMMG
jgi:hypothetical protein